ncbi:MAG: rhodanese-like domain-containing protein [Bacillota bacterium]|nr:rhodanese-like domain-containing protein [Bacillota bacterium]
MRKSALLILLMGLIFLMMGCTSTGYKDLSANQAKELIDQQTDLQLLDVREEVEYAEGHIEGSVLIPLGQLGDRISELDPEKPVLLICRSGNRSGQAADLLVKEGFKDVNNLEKGILQWPYDLVQN